LSDDELLEVFDAAGHPSGVAKTRAAVHRDGDWHLAFFCWIFRGDDVVLQKRALFKDVWPGRFDASAAGHVRFGETTAEAAREIDEELGIMVDPRSLYPLMRHFQEHVHANGIIDREIHDVHLLRCELPLEEYRPGPEVTALVAVPFDALLELVSGTRESIATTLGELHQGDLVPYDLAYWRALYSGRASMARR
jgi:isopentenyldiphosphate isomerase